MLPPQQLNFAVLPYRARDKTVFPLCRKCAEEDQTDTCNHNEHERRLEGIYTFHELFTALRRGYQVQHIFEVRNNSKYNNTRLLLHTFQLWDYGAEKEQIFKEYVTKMIKLKTQHSPVPEQMTGEEFCDMWNERVPGIDIKPEDLHASPAMRQSAKILMNSLWGEYSFKKKACYIFNLFQHFRKVL